MIRIASLLLALTVAAPTQPESRQSAAQEQAPPVYKVGFDTSRAFVVECIATGRPAAPTALQPCQNGFDGTLLPGH
jgi:hypothetical protein